MTLRQLAGTALLLCASLAAHGHASSTTYLTVDAREGEALVPVRWEIPVRELHRELDLDPDGDGRITWGETHARRAAIAGLASRHLALRRGGAPCEASLDDLRLRRLAGEPHASLSFTASCARDGPFEVSATLFFAADSSQRALVELWTPTGSATTVLSPHLSRWREPRGPWSWGSLSRFIGEGAWHVWIGYDHVAFLLLLLLPSVVRAARSAEPSAPRDAVRDVAIVVTAFTVAHSLTLSLAATGAARLPIVAVEATIAASIVAAGLLNLYRPVSRWRLPLAFGFGLVHGFGFASALAELGLEGARLVPALVGFNVGVELGQLAIVVLVLPLLLRLRSKRFFEARVLPAASAATAGLGAVWLILRL